MTTNSNANQISTTHECWKAIHISLVGRPDCALGSSYSPDYFGLQKTIKLKPYEYVSDEVQNTYSKIQ